MKVVHLEQNTPEWLAWRAQRHTASEAPIIAGVAPSWWALRTWDDLHARKAGLGEGPVSAYTQSARVHGHEQEATARHLAEQRYGVPYAATCVEDAAGRFGASLDGYQLEHPGSPLWLEIKCPARGVRSESYRTVDQGDFPPALWWQLVHQAGVLSPDPDTMAGIVVMPECAADTLYREISARALLADWPALAQKWNRFDAYEQPGRADVDWLVAAGAWRTAQAKATAAKAELEHAKAALLQLATSDREEGGGIRLTRTTRAGGLHYRAWSEALAQRLIALGVPAQDIETDKATHQKPDVTVVTVKEV